MTKTFKRVAAIAALALGIGGLTGVAANAADGAFTITAGTNTGSAVAATVATTAGANNFVGFTIATTNTANQVITVTGGTASNGNAQVAGSGTSNLIVTPTGASVAGFVVPTPTVGTITVKTYGFTNGVQNALAASSLVITVTAAPTGVGVVSSASSSAYALVANKLASAETPGNIDTLITAPLAADDTSLSAPKGTPNTYALAGSIVGTLKDSRIVPSGVAAKTLVATVSGPGLVVGNSGTDTNLGTTPAKVATTVTSTDPLANSSNHAGQYAFNVYSDGTSGTSTVTISYTDSANVTVVIATKTFVFYGAEATFTPTVKFAYIPSSGAAYPQNPATSLSYAVKIVAKDANGAPVTGVTPTVLPADTTKISSGACTASTASGSSYCYLVGVAGASGKSAVAFYTGAASTFNLVTTSVDITVSSIKASTLTVTASDSVASGQVVTYTITAADANGLPIPDGTLVSNYLAASPTIAGGALQDFGSASGNTQATLFAGVKFANGSASDSVQAPFGATSLVATFDGPGLGAAVTGDANFATAALKNFETILTTTVGSDPAVQSAIDAAQEATDAANAAYDAANNAMDSADAATAAAQEASDNAAAALAAVTELATTVANLVAKVNSMAATIAKIAKKVKA